MGLAASQARLLTITARLADNELRSQTINNAKMRLATQSAQASDEYVSALNNAQMMFTNTGADGLTQNQALTFNALTQYSQYNNQYGIVNSAGQIMVSEEEARIFEGCSNNLELFLKAHNLEWETTFFDESQGDLAEKITSFYGTGSNKYIGDLFAGKSNEDLKQIYLDSLSEEASIEKLNYTRAAQNYYNEVMSLYENAAPELRQEILGPSTSSITEESVENAIAALSDATSVKKELIIGNLDANKNIVSDDDDNGALFSLNYLQAQGYINDTYIDFLKKKVMSLTDGTNCAAGNLTGNAGLSVEETQIKKSTSSTSYKKINGETETIDYNTYTFGTSPTFTIAFKKPILSEKFPKHKDDDEEKEIEYYYQTITGYENSITCSDSAFNVSAAQSTLAGISEGSFYNSSTGEYNITTVTNILNGIWGDTMKGDGTKGDGTIATGGKTIYRYVNINEYTGETPEYYICKIPMGQEGANNKHDVYKALAEYYLEAVLDTEDAFNAIGYAGKNTGKPTLKNFQDSITAFSIYGVSISLPNDAKCLMDFEEMVKKKLSGTTPNDYMKSVLNTYMADKMLDVLGEPKYAWVDKSDSTNIGNADAKAQWLSNLFNRMQKGYKVLENGLAKSQEWLQYAFESGLVRMEQVDLSYNWVSMDYKSCSNIYEQTDNSAAVAKAEAKYNRAMNDIKQKDSMFDLQLKNIDTEHSALQTEYDVVKNVMNKNIERTMKFNQSA